MKVFVKKLICGENIRKRKCLFTTHYLNSDTLSKDGKWELNIRSFETPVLLSDYPLRYICPRIICTFSFSSRASSDERAFKDVSVSRYRPPRSIGVRGTYSLSSLRNVLGTSITFEVKMVNVLSRSSNVTFPRRVNCPFKSRILRIDEMCR